MKEIGVTFTILKTIYVPDDYQEELVENLIDEELIELSLDRDEVDDIEWGEINR